MTSIEPRNNKIPRKHHLNETMIRTSSEWWSYCRCWHFCIAVLLVGGTILTVFDSTSANTIHNNPFFRSSSNSNSSSTTTTATQVQTHSTTHSKADAKKPRTHKANNEGHVTVKVNHKSDQGDASHGSTRSSEPEPKTTKTKHKPHHHKSKVSSSSVAIIHIGPRKTGTTAIQWI